MVKTLSFHCKGSSSFPGQGTEIAYAWPKNKNKLKKKKNPAPAEGNIPIYLVTYLKTSALFPVHPGPKSLPVFPSFPSLAAIILHLTLSFSHVAITWCLLVFSTRRPEPESIGDISKTKEPPLC